MLIIILIIAFNGVPQVRFSYVVTVFLWVSFYSRNHLFWPLFWTQLHRSNKTECIGSGFIIIFALFWRSIRYVVVQINGRKYYYKRYVLNYSPLHTYTMERTQANEQRSRLCLSLRNIFLCISVCSHLALFKLLPSWWFLGICIASRSP